VIRGSWTTEIPRPPEEVFDYVADLDNEPEWNPGVSNVVKRRPEPARPTWAATSSCSSSA
jgi:uncharacterized protein YndB with AHSA1/START domain